MLYMLIIILVNDPLVYLVSRYLDNRDSEPDHTYNCMNFSYPNYNYSHRDPICLKNIRIFMIHIQIHIPKLFFQKNKKDLIPKNFLK